MYCYEYFNHTWKPTTNQKSNDTTCNVCATRIIAVAEIAAGHTITATDIFIIIKIPTAVHGVCNCSIK